MIRREKSRQDCESSGVMVDEVSLRTATSDYWKSASTRTHFCERDLGAEINHNHQDPAFIFKRFTSSVYTAN
ncbi:hypothetical protein MPTK1_2g25920 [Marchantia polymorpha subsp. ruderalis]|uniref:Uncharacterized protein n=1 Tax=Marchantia polymorpha TaxID=3197 RepID=A0A2R6XBC0_MARPO|nr:hypothetical protein MARPO_0025s0087 [Marchantia polymorpha]BBN03730.1 hypothetical protein Mp_2g25920 [Marchantia polymorpha subsp. ruderalis]|eukprot:PTQ43403.1 hypothetical protein MARPO_0025s0087 [Marchantia polymorpha]